MALLKLERIMISYLKGMNEDFYTVTSKIDGRQYILNKQDDGIFNLIINKIVRLMYESSHLDSILILTDTPSHTCELKSRIALCIGEKRVQSLWINTFYDFYVRFYRTEILPINKTIEIYDSNVILRNIIRHLQLDKKIYNLGAVINEISYAKKNLILPDENGKVDNLTRWHNGKLRSMSDIYAYYWNFCKKRNIIDCDDFAIKTFFLFNERPDILHKYIGKFDNILVSNEYNQSYVDSRMLSLLLDRTIYSEGEWIDYRYTNYRRNE